IIDGARAPRPQPPGASPGGQIVAAAEVAAARGRAAAAGEGARAPSVLAGFYDMTGAQLAFSDALDRASLLSAIFIPVGGGEAYRFAQPFVRHFADALPDAGEPTLRVRETRIGVTELETR